MMHLRDAEETDLPAIRDIYNDAVLNTTAIWNDTQVDLENRMTWLTERRRLGYPVIVAETGDGVIAGYASFGDWRAFDGYRHTVEHSVYVEKNQRGSGIGKMLMLALIERAAACGKHVMVAGIEAGNTSSILLHEKLGFETTGQMKEVGTKFGRWLDLTFMQLILPEQR